jgi:predicted permease
MFKLLFTMAVGYYLARKEILTKEVNRKLSTMIVDVTVPLLIISSASTAPADGKGDVILMLVGGAVLYCFFPLFGFLAAKLVRAPKGQTGIYTCMMMFANTAFMGYPVVQALYGASSIFYTTIFNFGYNVLFYTIGSYLIDKEGGAASKFDPRRLLSAGLITGILSIVLYFSGITLPDLIIQPCSFIGNITTPMSMLIIGANMYGFSFKDIFGEKRLYVMTFLRLIVMPLITAFYLSLLTDNKALICMASITIGMPIGSMVAMAGSKYENTARVSNICVVMSTLCSMITIPILVVIFKLWFGV